MNPVTQKHCSDKDCKFYKKCLVANIEIAEKCTGQVVKDTQSEKKQG